MAANAGRGGRIEVEEEVHESTGERGEANRMWRQLGARGDKGLVVRVFTRRLTRCLMSILFHSRQT